MTEEERQPLAIYSPMPPSRSGIADYCCDSLPEFVKRRRVIVVIDDEVDGPPPDALPREVEVRRASEWASDPRSRTIPRLYHLGNNPHHAFVYRAALQSPGTLVMHDYCLHHLVVHETLVRGDLEGYARAMERDQGEAGRTLAGHRNIGAFTDFQQFLLPLNAEVISNSTGVICHSRENLSRLRDRFPDRRVAQIPLHFCQPRGASLAGSRSLARNRLGIPGDELVITVPGFITPQKQVPLLLQALGDVQDRLPPFSLRLVGEPWDREALTRLIEASGIADRVSVTGFTSETDFFNHIEAADIVSNLRYPSAGETSGTLIQAMALGRCALVFDYESFSDFPNQALAKIPLDTFSSVGLAQRILELAQEPARRHRIEQTALAYVPTRHSLQDYVAAVDDFVKLCSASP